MKKSRLLLTSAFFAVLVTATFWVIFKNNDIGKVIQAVKGVDPFYIVVAILCSFTFVICEGTNSYLLLNTLGEKISIFKGIKYACVGFFFSSITPSATGGQPMQILSMKRDRIPITKSSLALILELISYQIVVMGLAGIFFFSNYEFIADKIGFIKPLLLYGFIANAALLLFIISIVFSGNTTSKIGTFFVKMLGKVKIIKNADKAQSKIDREIGKFKKGIELIKSKPMLFIKVISITTVQLAAMYSVVFFIYKSFGLGGNSFAEILALKSTLNLAMCALPLPGGIGITEASFVKVFSAIFTADIATSAMLIDRGITFYLLVILAGMICLGGFIQYKYLGAKNMAKETKKLEKIDLIDEVNLNIKQ